MRGEWSLPGPSCGTGPGQRGCHSGSQRPLCAAWAEGDSHKARDGKKQDAQDHQDVRLKPKDGKNSMDRIIGMYGSRPKTARNRIDRMIRTYGWTAQTAERESKGGSDLILSYPVVSCLSCSTSGEALLLLVGAVGEYDNQFAKQH